MPLLARACFLHVLVPHRLHALLSRSDLSHQPPVCVSDAPDPFFSTPPRPTPDADIRPRIPKPPADVILITRCGAGIAHGIDNVLLPMSMTTVTKYI
jgi:hypothetical protein